MNKKNMGSISLLITGFLAITIVTVVAFNNEKITHKYYEYKIKKEYKNIKTNDYFLEDYFSYVDNNMEPGIKSKKELINFIYYALNNGIDFTERYIDTNYVEYIKDINDLTSNNGEKIKNIVSTLNNYVHPFNSSSNIKINYGGNYKIGLTITKTYNEEEIEKINEIVDNVISEKIHNNTPTKEKIKIIHDYIIDNTKYDILKYDNINDTTYKSNTAYGVLVEGFGTCNGYSDAMAIFLNKLNIINYKINSEEHIWNLVFIDGKWYHLDLTWDDPISEKNTNRDTYFLITNEKLEKLNDGAHNFDKEIYIEALQN